MDEDLTRFERFVLGLPKPLRLLALALILALGVVLLSLPLWRRLLS